jgi:uncharacterized protein YodC (DUF2158 family)
MADKAQIQIGDTVKLRSGGPLMTVNEIIPAAQTTAASAFVSWFDTENKPQHFTYPITSLRKVSSK